MRSNHSRPSGFRFGDKVIRSVAMTDASSPVHPEGKDAGIAPQAFPLWQDTQDQRESKQRFEIPASMCARMTKLLEPRIIQDDRSTRHDQTSLSR
jgi:hypothetical protein